MHQYDGHLLALPKKLEKFWLGWVNVYLKNSIIEDIWAGVFRIGNNEVVVFSGDYLVLDKGRLYYYPKDQYEWKNRWEEYEKIRVE